MFRRGDNDSAGEVPKMQPVRPEPIKAKSVGADCEQSIIGVALHVKGEIDGAQDLLVEGIVEGVISLNQNTVVVGQSGRVQADIHAKVITVKGQVTGNLFGADQVIIHASGLVVGNIRAPRVSLEDGARIKGSIDTDPPANSAVAVSSTSTRNETGASKDTNKEKKEEGVRPAAMPMQ